jgi:phosphoribosylformylglycinamidine synthase
MAARAGTGIELDLSLVPQREQGMTAYEMLLSESQERMLIVTHAGREREVIDIFRKWDLDAVVIGRVRDDQRMRVIHNGDTVADIPVAALTDEAPRYTRPMAAGLRSQVSGFRLAEGESDGAKSVPPAIAGGSQVAEPSGFSQSSKVEDSNYNDSLIKLLASPNIASKEWVYRQYDHMVRTNTAVLPGADAAVVRIKETRRALAISLDGNGRYCAANPREGAKLLVAEAARNVVCVGAQPLAITNCLNFASPERPEVMWSFSEVVDGMAEACNALGTPVVSGNVSFYNETEGRGILPTPVIGMVGLVDDVRRIVQPGFKNEGDFIALLGRTHDDLSISEYASVIGGQTLDQMIAQGRVPELNLETEKAVQTACLRAAEAGLLNSAHDCADGGMAVALAESCFTYLNRAALGANIDLTGEYSIAARLFGESPSRIIISFAEAGLGDIEETVARAGCAMTILGRVNSDRLRIQSDGVDVMDLSITEMETAWRSSLAQRLRAEVMAAGAE